MAFAWDIRDALQKVIEGNNSVGADGVPELLRRPQEVADSEPPAEKPLPYVVAGPPTAAEQKHNLPITPETDKLVEDTTGVSKNKPIGEPTWTEKLAKRYEEELNQREKERQFIMNKWRKEKGLSYTDEEGKPHEANRGLLGITGYLNDRPDAQKRILSESLSNLNHIRFGPGAPESKMLAPTGEAQEGAKIMQELGMSKMQGLQGMAGMGREIEAERRQALMETPGNVRAKSALEFLKSFPQGEVWVKQLAASTPDGEEGLSAADLDPYVKYATQYGLGKMKDETARHIAEDKLTAAQQKSEDALNLARARFLHQIAKDQAAGDKETLIKDPKTGEVTAVKLNGRVYTPEQAYALAKVGKFKVAPAAVQEYETAVSNHHDTFSGGAPAAAVTPTPGGSAPTAAPVAPPTPPAVGTAGGRVVKPPTYDNTTKEYDKALRQAIGGKDTPEAQSVKKSAQTVQRAKQLEALVNGPITPNSFAELAAATNVLVTGNAAAAESMRKELTPLSLDKSAALLRQYFTSAPAELSKPEEWVEWFRNIARREREVAEQNIHDVAVKGVSAGIPLREHEIKKYGTPKQYETTLKSAHVNPEAFDENGQPIPGKDTRWWGEPNLDNKPAGWDNSWVRYRIIDKKDKRYGRQFWAPPGKALIRGVTEEVK